MFLLILTWLGSIGYSGIKLHKVADGGQHRAASTLGVIVLAIYKGAGVSDEVNLALSKYDDISCNSCLHPSRSLFIG